MRQQVGQAAGPGVIVAAQLVRQQQAGVLAARLGGFQAEFRVEQDGAGVRSEDLAHRHFELAHHLMRDLFDIHAAPRGQRLLEASSLIHGGGRDDASLVGYRFHALQLAL